jgi:peptidoglycan hydrolase-like protein with peptidoglycan-binding domain
MTTEAPPPTTVAPPPPLPNNNQMQTCDPKSPQLKIRSGGAKVLELQSYLKQLGYGSLLGDYGPNHDGIDGKFGEATKKAVMKLQEDKRLKVDGIVGPNTWAAICASVNSLVNPTSWEIQPKVHYISVDQPSEQQQQDIPILPESSTSISEPNADPTEDPGAEIIEEEGSDQALGVAFPSINNTEIIRLVGNVSSQQIPQTEMSENLSEIILTEPPSDTFDQQQFSSDNFTQPLPPPPAQQQQLVDEFGNVIPTEPPSDTFDQQQFSSDNFTQPLPPPSNAAMTSQVEICDNFDDDDRDGLADFDDPEGCSP